MKREAFKMYLKPGYEAEYEKRHAAIWPELKALLSKMGCRIILYIGIKKPIFYLLSRKQKEKEVRRTWATQRLYRNGGDYMADIMEVNPDNSPVSIPLPEVFHMD